MDNTICKDSPVLAYLHMVAGLTPCLEGYGQPVVGEHERIMLGAMLKRHQSNVAYYSKRHDAYGDGDQELNLIIDKVHARVELRCGTASGSVTRMAFKREFEHDEWDRAKVLMSAVEYGEKNSTYDVRMIIPHALPETALAALQGQIVGSVLKAEKGQGKMPGDLKPDGTAPLESGYLPPSFNIILALLADWEVRRAENMGHTLLVLGKPTEG